MNIESILTPERTFANLESTSKKRLLEKASGVLASAEPGISEQHLYSNLIAREKIGPTAIGNGIAIPHCMVECSRTFAALFKLSRGIDFGAIDEVPVRIVFVLIVPQNEANTHLETLVVISGRSGSGKSTALHVLEDMGFYCIDNLPVTLLKPLVDHLPLQPRLAVSIDARNIGEDLLQFPKILKTFNPLEIHLSQKI